MFSDLSSYVLWIVKLHCPFIEASNIKKIQKSYYLYAPSRLPIKSCGNNPPWMPNAKLKLSLPLDHQTPFLIFREETLNLFLLEKPSWMPNAKLLDLMKTLTPPPISQETFCGMSLHCSFSPKNLKKTP